MTLAILLMAALEIWQYPVFQQRHEWLRNDFRRAMAVGNAVGMERDASEAVKIYADDCTWRYNLACALARQKKKDEAFDALEEAIDLGFRNAEVISKDDDWKSLSEERRFKELIEYANSIATRPILTGPLAAVNATGVFGQSVAIGRQNLGWNFDLGLYDVKMSLSVASAGGNTGDLYMNRDNGHAVLNTSGFPALTVVKLDQELRDHGVGKNLPDMLFPYPVFGNCSMAYLNGDFWRSLPRSLMTTNVRKLNSFIKLYLSNQIWVFPICNDGPPIGNKGDVFPAAFPFCICTQGRSWSDLPYVSLALEASRSFQSDVKREIVRRGLLAPTIITLIRKSFTNVTDDVSYLSPRAHPTAFPSAGNVDRRRLAATAAAMTVQQIPPLAVLAVKLEETTPKPTVPELAYFSPFSWCYVFRDRVEERSVVIAAKGAKEFRFVQTHGAGAPAKIENLAANGVRVTVSTRDLSPTNRIDIAVFGRNPGTSWGAPSYVSLSRLDAKAPYNDPYFVRLSEATAK